MDSDKKNEYSATTKVVDTDSKPANADDARLAQLGHTQELNRQFSLVTLGALCICLMGTWEALSSVIATALLSGGAPCLFYNLSAASFMTGWISVGGQIVLTSSAAFAAGLQMQALIVLNNDSYTSARWQGMLFYWAVLVYAMALNIWGSKLLPTANLLSGVLHIGGFFAILIVLGVMAPKNTASFVFTEFVNSSGWDNDGVSWLVGLLSAVYPFLGYDAACHLAEEMPNASRNVPIAMIGSVAANGLMGLVYGTMLLFSTSSLASLLETKTGFPFMQIFMDVTKSNAGATVMSVVIIATATAATVAGVTSTSRTLWAFARDRATPYDEYLSKVNKSQQIPVRSVVLITVLQMLLGFIYLGNTTAFNAILSMAIIGMYASYMIPIIYMLIFGRKTLTRSDYGPFKLGPVLGPTLNIVSLVWIVVVVIFSTFPSAMPVTPQNMNYSVVVIAGWLLFGVIYYIGFAKNKFEVPLVGSQAITGVPIGEDSSC
ncbi:hypothetical protein G7Z17_g1242 [Cylindrodendrum hubeiense]|uniref:Amino acid permease n=1 Tax=Cylindrodendrum hubeiense TaxID=595255 RepID=A0A9P5HF86_9HYPO|nr:hypothetical protein G7Z17_g1242 [Cylindrodendrum hubeiense]